MSLKIGNGNLAIIIENTVGTTHTTNIYLIPLWIIAAILAAIILPVWITRRKSRDPNDSKGTTDGSP
jgi:hypothetical protein